MKYHFTVPEEKRVRVIVSSDTACEADDPFAIAHALLSPKLDVRAVIAEHFWAACSMEDSFVAARHLLDLMASPVPLLHGQPKPGVPEISEGAQFIIDEARREDDRPLYILCMGAVTTMAAALAAAPDIADRCTLVTIGGHSYGAEAYSWIEYNWGNDPEAINFILRDTVLPVWQIPSNAYTSMRVGLAELQRKVMPCGKVGAYLLRQMDEYNNCSLAGWTAGESWSLGDNPCVAVVLNPGCGEHHTQNAWLIDADTHYTEKLPDRQIEVYRTVDSRYVLEDLFAKLAINFG